MNNLDECGSGCSSRSNWVFQGTQRVPTDPVMASHGGMLGVLLFVGFLRNFRSRKVDAGYQRVQRILLSVTEYIRKRTKIQAGWMLASLLLLSLLPILQWDNSNALSYQTDFFEW